MRIDERKVNGSIMIDNTDIIDGFTIMINRNVPEWVFGTTRQISKSKLIRA